MESDEDLKEFSHLCEQSVMWKSKPSQSQTWLQRLKKVKWMKLLFLRTLKPSLTESFVDAWTSSLRDSHVNPFPSQEKSKELKTPGTSTLTYQKALPFADQDMSYWKTLKESLVEKQQTENRYSSMSLEIWKAEVIRVRGEHSARLKLVRHTLEKESSSLQSWGTPKEQDSRAATWDRGKHNLGEQVHGSWRTPTSRDWKGVTPSENKIKRGETVKQPYITLPGQVNTQQDLTKNNLNGKNPESFPTPRTSDAEGGRIETLKTKDGFKSLRKSSNQIFGAKLRDAVEMEEPPKYRLNPSWVEQLMGLPVNWTQLSTEWID